MSDESRLSARVSEQKGCSRREAERYIEGGWVRVDGTTVDVPGTRLPAESRVDIDPGATLEPVADVTILLHKPAGHDAFDVEGLAGARPAARLLRPELHAAGDRSGIRYVRRHLVQQQCLTPLETRAAGLVVFSQDWRIQRKLLQEAASVEHETIVDVRGTVDGRCLQQLNRAPVIDGRAMLPYKVSISAQSDSTTGLRVAGKGYWPGRIAQMCDAAGLEITGMKRIRIGRVALSNLPTGQWYFLVSSARF